MDHDTDVELEAWIQTWLELRRSPTFTYQLDELLEMETAGCSQHPAVPFGKTSSVNNH